jgi:hypothetical protein
MKKQSAVQWLVEQVNSDCLNSAFIRPELVEQANKMFEEQIIKSFDEGQEYYHIHLAPKFYSKAYYDETYGGNK